MSIMLLVAAMVSQQSVTTTNAAPAREKRICRKMIRTGSLVGSKRECRTAAEWDKLSSAARLNSEDITQRNAGGLMTN